MEVLILLVLIGLMYFCPTIIAAARGHHSKGGIIALNILLGWTILGWIIALIWSFTNPGGREVTIINVQQMNGSDESKEKSPRER